MDTNIAKVNCEEQGCRAVDNEGVSIVVVFGEIIASSNHWKHLSRDVSMNNGGVILDSEISENDAVSSKVKLY